MHAHDRLPLRALVRRQWAGLDTGAYLIARTFRAQPDMNSLQPLHASLECGRQRLISRGAVREYRLPLTLRNRNDPEKQRDIRWRAAIALVGVPTPAMREPRRQFAILGQWRVGPA